MSAAQFYIGYISGIKMLHAARIDFYVFYAFGPTCWLFFLKGKQTRTGATRGRLGATPPQIDLPAPSVDEGLRVVKK